MKNETDALEWLKLCEFPYWRVTGRESSKNILSSKENEENENQRLDLQDSANFFEKTTKLLPDGLYVVYGRRNAKGSAGEKQYDFEVNESKTPLPKKEGINGIDLANIHSSHIGLVVEYERKLTDERHKYNDLKLEKELKIRDLESQLRDAKKEDNTLDRVIQIAGVVDKWFGGSQGSPTATVAGTQTKPDNTTEEEKKAIINRIWASVKVLADTIGDDGETAIAMEALAKFASQNPSSFKSYLEFLKKQ